MHDLRALQKWFGGVVAAPLDLEAGDELRRECGALLTDGPHLKSHERIAIYNRLYWYRLLGHLHKSFPFLVRLFGYDEFNQKIAAPYLIQHPPSEWALSTLGDLLPGWLEKEYHAKDRELVFSAAELDLLHEKLFSATALPALKKASQKIILQPYAAPVRMRGNLLALRNIFLENPVEYWEAATFPRLSDNKIYYYALFRGPTGVIVYEEICAARYHLLSLLKEGKDLEELCADLSKREESFEGIEAWFQEWMLRGWLA